MITKRDRVVGGLLGVAVGDALGVPMEFVCRPVLRRNPITEMRGFGSHNQPAGTWSDDTSLTLCTVESLCRGLDLEDMGRRFVRWAGEGYWSARGEVFDIGLTTSSAIGRLASGANPLSSGRTDRVSNGNGSLMRILPVALYFADKPDSVLLDAVHRVSAITHAHPRSLAACGIYALLVRELMAGKPIFDAHAAACATAVDLYGKSAMRSELEHFERLLSGALALSEEQTIRSGGYVVDTLEASIWCLLCTGGFESCVLSAVNLGEDTDTVGAVAGGLAGACYGASAMPVEWVRSLARSAEIISLADAFANCLGGPA